MRQVLHLPFPASTELSLPQRHISPLLPGEGDRGRGRTAAACGLAAASRRVQPRGCRQGSLPWRVAVVCSHSVGPAAKDKDVKNAGALSLFRRPARTRRHRLCMSLAASKDTGGDADAEQRAAADAKKHAAVEALGKLLLQFSNHELLWPCFNIHNVQKLSRLRIGLQYAPGAAPCTRAWGLRAMMLSRPRTVVALMQTP